MNNEVNRLRNIGNGQDSPNLSNIQYNHNMAIPDFQTVMLPVLKKLADGKERGIRTLVDQINSEFRLTEDEKQELLPSGTQPIIDNRVGWAVTYLKKAGLVESTRRGYACITRKGLEVLSKNVEKINVKYLEQFPEFVEFRTVKRNKMKTEVLEQKEKIENVTPDELITNGFNLIQENLAHELIEKLRKGSPAFFEKVVLSLLSNMGYGEGKVTGKAGDGGIDGSISQDRLGLDKVLFQAKRYGENTSVSISDVREFIGALDSNKVNKGVFITTSKFPKEAESVVSKGSKSIILVDGAQLVEYMIEYDIGVSISKTYKIKKMDSDFFSEF